MATRWPTTFAVAVLWTKLSHDVVAQTSNVRWAPLARLLGQIRPPRQVPLARPKPVVKRLGRGRRVIEHRHPGPADRGRGPGPALELVGGRGARVALSPLRR